MDYVKFRAKLEEMGTTLTTSEKVEKLNEKTVRIPTPVKKSDVERYLITIGKYFDLKQSTNETVIRIMATLALFETFDCTIHDVMIKYTQAINSLSALELLSEAERDTLVGMAYKNISWAEANLGSDLTSSDLFNSGVLKI